MTWILYESKLKNISQTCNINHLQKRRWFFVIIYNPSETGRSLGTGSVLSMKMGVSVNRNTYGCGRRPEKRLFLWTGRCFLGRRPIKWAFFWPRRWKNKKRHPRKDVSVYGVEQGGMVEKPWPPVASWMVVSVFRESPVDFRARAVGL